jgi:hypothetical protein
LYEVRCGRDRIGDDEQSGAQQSRWDMPYGVDPGTGFSWGYSSYGTSGARSEGKAWESGVRYDEGDTPGQGLTYRFQVPPGRYAVELGFRDPWNNAARKMDVFVEGRLVEANLVAGNQTMTRRLDVNLSDDVLEVTARRAKNVTEPGADPLLSWIKISAAS